MKPTRRRFLQAGAVLPALPGKDDFRSPASRFRPITWYWPQRPDAAAIAAELTQLKQTGIGGVCVYPETPHLQVKYLSPEFWETMRIAIEEAVRLNFRVWLYDEFGYPSSSAGGYVLAHHPEFAVTGLEYENGRAEMKKGDPLAAIAKGRAGLVRPLSNLMDANAGREFVSCTYEGYARIAGRYFGREVEAIFTDEPCLHVAGFWDFGEKEAEHRPLLPWVDGFPEYFRARKGYDIMPLLPSLLGDGGPETARIRCDYWDLVCDLVLEGYFDPIADWCARHRIAFTGHLLLEESLMLHLMFTGSLIRALSRMHIPGIDLIGPRPDSSSLEATMTGMGGVWVAKYASSAAHTRGRIECMCETFAASGTTMTPEKMIATANWLFVAGITEVMPMTRHYRVRRGTETAQNEPPPDEFTRHPEWFATYLARVKSMLSGGDHLADVAMLVPESSIRANYVPAPVGLPYAAYRARNPEAAAIDDDFAALSSTLLRSQTDFDYLDDEIFLQAEIGAGRIHLAGESYGFLVLPRTTHMRYAIAAKVAEFQQAGGRVAALGALPREALERGSGDALKKALERVPVLGTPDEVAGLIAKASRPDVRLARPAPKLYYLHHRNRNRDIYFLVNMDDQVREHEIEFRAGRRASIWDPRTGEISAWNGKSVKLERLSALFVVFG